ncbi:hypothetical protein WN48_04175 [Eufriesea mexicana]|nr:hypothetical protein WN48_04175 [Eufriesea mexicana]
MKVNFSCINRTAGFYADTSANCKIYHTCDEFGNKFTYQCPEETAFRQDALICDHAHLVYCKENTSSSTKEYIREEKNNNSLCTKESLNKYHTTQSTNPDNKVGYRFVLNPRQLLKNLNETERIETKIINSFSPFSYINSSANISINCSINTNTQYTPIVDHHDEKGLQENESFPIQNQSFYYKDRLNEKPRMNQKGYLHQKINDVLYNYLKVPLNTVTRNVQIQEHNIKDDQPTKNPTDFLKLSSINYRNYPYLETLKSIQKNTKIPSTTIGIGTTNIALATTELPVYALTLSLKPLVPSELEYDPYYPKFSTTTESYYTPPYDIKEWSYIGNSTQTVWPTTHFELPLVLPDLNSLDDIVDRRKLLYIPRIKFN